jgi:hypothetical protein
LWLVILLTITISGLTEGIEIHIVVAGYIVDHHCLMFDRGVVHIVVLVILFTITARCLTEEWFMLLWLVILLTITV